MSGAEYVAGAVLVLWGLLEIVTNKPLRRGAQSYTEESLRRYARPSGVMIMIMGVTFFAFLYTLRKFFDEKMSGVVVIICLVLMILSMIGHVVVGKKILVKK